MKTIIFIFSLILFSSDFALAAADPLDLATLKKAGLSQETLSRFLAQNLDSTRLAPQIDANFLARLAAYGGDELASSYLTLDSHSAGQSEPTFSPEAIGQLLDADIGSARLKKVMDNESLKAAALAEQSKPQTAEPVENSYLEAPMPTAPQVTEAENILPPQTASAPPPPVEPQIQSAPTASAPATGVPVVQAPEVSPVQAPEVSPVQAPEVAAVQPPPAYQTLRPGQSADPSQPLPPDLTRPGMRIQETPGPWLGVMEKELPDGHLVEANISGDNRVVGQEVLVRPSGHKVYRYFSGNPDNPQSGTDPTQEAINRENLQIIFQGSRGAAADPAK